MFYGDEFSFLLLKKKREKKIKKREEREMVDHQKKRFCVNNFIFLSACKQVKLSKVKKKRGSSHF